MILLVGHMSQDLILHINADRRQSTVEHFPCLSCFMPGFSAVAWSDKFLYMSAPRQVVCIPLPWHKVDSGSLKTHFGRMKLFLIALTWYKGNPRPETRPDLHLLSPGLRTLPLPLPSAKI